MSRLVCLWLAASLDMVIFLPGIHSHGLSFPEYVAMHSGKTANGMFSGSFYHPASVRACRACRALALACFE